jgi:hypothetical protein
MSEKKYFDKSGPQFDCPCGSQINDNVACHKRHNATMKHKAYMLEAGIPKVDNRKESSKKNIKKAREQIAKNAIKKALARSGEKYEFSDSETESESEPEPEPESKKKSESPPIVESKIIEESEPKEKPVRKSKLAPPPDSESDDDVDVSVAQLWSKKLSKKDAKIKALADALKMKEELEEEHKDNRETIKKIVTHRKVKAVNQVFGGLKF